MKKDPRPICKCSARPFPHKIDDKKCGGRAFFEFYLYNIKEHCLQCNCFREEDNGCDAMDGRESIKEAECYREAMHQAPSENLQIEWNEDDY